MTTQQLNFKRSFFLLIVVFFTINTATAQTEYFDYLSPASPDSFTFARGDGLRLLIYEENVEAAQNRFISNFHNKEFAIDGTGNIRLGSRGLVKIAGLSVEESTELLMEKLKPYSKNPQIVIIPLIRIILRGEFGQPGMYRFNPSTSFWDMIAEAGGVSNTLELEEMFVIRKGSVLHKNFTEALYHGVSLRELGLKSGDEIIAPRVNRVSFYSIMRYFNFITSFVILYYTIKRRG